MLFLVMSCLFLFFLAYSFLSFRWDWRLTRGPTVYRLALELFFFGLGTQGHGVRMLQYWIWCRYGQMYCT